MKLSNFSKSRPPETKIFEFFYFFYLVKLSNFGKSGPPEAKFLRFFENLMK